LTVVLMMPMPCVRMDAATWFHLFSGWGKGQGDSISPAS
jgi:hypothetical protein